MSSVAIVDTSIFCNVLDIPHMNGEKKRVIKDLETFLENETTLLLPMAAVYETGNHIAQLSDGSKRRRCAENFVVQVRQAISGEAPWQVMQVPTTQEIQEWLSGFPDSAMRGASMGDLSIIKEWEKMKKRIPGRRIFIWSLDNDLKGYDYNP